MVSTMWRANSRGEIEQVECSKVTEKCVFIVAEPIRPGNMYRYAEPQKRAKRSSYCSYYETWEDAHAELLSKADKDLTRARLMLARAQGNHGRVKGMKPPADAELLFKVETTTP